MECCEYEFVVKKYCFKKFDLKNVMDNCVRDFVDMNKIYYDYLYLCCQEQVIFEDSMVSSDVSFFLGIIFIEC